MPLLLREWTFGPKNEAGVRREQTKARAVEQPLARASEIEEAAADRVEIQVDCSKISSRVSAPKSPGFRSVW